MQDLAIFAIGHQRSRWLAAHTAVVARNVANADTPGFRPGDIEPFESVLSGRRVALAATNGGHMSLGEGGRAVDFVVTPRSGGALKHSGNGIGLEREMASLGEARSQHAMTTGILGSFHRLLLTASRG